MGYRINYSGVVMQANVIADCSKRLQTQERQLEEIESVVRGGWKGDAASVFLSKLNSLRCDVEKTKMQINTLSESIRNCADRIKKEDEEQALEARTLGGKGGG